MPNPGPRLPLLSLLAVFLCLPLLALSAQGTEMPTGDLLDDATRFYLEAGHVAEAIESHARHQQRRGEVPTAATFLAALLEVDPLPRERGSGEPAPQDESDSSFRAPRAAERVEQNLFRHLRNVELPEPWHADSDQASAEVESYLEDLHARLQFLGEVFGPRLRPASGALKHKSVPSSPPWSAGPT